MTDALVIIPTYDEAATIAATVGRVREAVPSADILIVDDASPDGTGAIADSLADADDRVHVLHRAGKAGLGAAYLAGFDWALQRDYRVIAQLDADGSHDPADLPTMIGRVRDQPGADLIIGSRWVTGGQINGWSRIRQFISRAGNRYARFVLGSRTHDLTAGFRVFRASALRRLPLDGVSSQGYCFQIELAWEAERARMRVVEHPVTFTERAAGRSKMHLGIVVEALVRVTAWSLTRRRRGGAGEGA